MDQNINGTSSFQLPSGPESNFYQLNLYVNIIDDSDGITQYNMPSFVIVKPDNDMFNNFTNSLLGSDIESLTKSLIAGNLKSATAFINSFTLMLDSQTVTNNTDTVFYYLFNYIYCISKFNSLIIQRMNQNGYKTRLISKKH